MHMCLLYERGSLRTLNVMSYDLAIEYFIGFAPSVLNFFKRASNPKLNFLANAFIVSEHSSFSLRMRMIGQHPIGATETMPSLFAPSRNNPCHAITNAACYI